MASAASSEELVGAARLAPRLHMQSWIFSQSSSLRVGSEDANVYSHKHDNGQDRPNPKLLILGPQLFHECFKSLTPEEKYHGRRAIQDLLGLLHFIICASVSHQGIEELWACQCRREGMLGYFRFAAKGSLQWLDLGGVGMQNLTNLLMSVDTARRPAVQVHTVLEDLMYSTHIWNRRSVEGVESNTIKHSITHWE